MGKKHLKEMVIWKKKKKSSKNPERYHFIPTRLVKFSKIYKTYCWHNEGKYYFHIFSVEIWCVTATWKAIWQDTLKLKINTSFDGPFLFWGSNPMKYKYKHVGTYVKSYLLQPCFSCKKTSKIFTSINRGVDEEIIGHFFSILWTFIRNHEPLYYSTNKKLLLY